MQRLVFLALTSFPALIYGAGESRLGELTRLHVAHCIKLAQGVLAPGSQGNVAQLKQGLETYWRRYRLTHNPPAGIPISAMQMVDRLSRTAQFQAGLAAMAAAKRGEDSDMQRSAALQAFVRNMQSVFPQASPKRSPA